MKVQVMKMSLLNNMRFMLSNNLLLLAEMYLVCVFSVIR